MFHWTMKAPIMMLLMMTMMMGRQEETSAQMIFADSWLAFAAILNRVVSLADHVMDADADDAAAVPDIVQPESVPTLCWATAGPVVRCGR
jgi:hypothetical protein